MNTYPERAKLPDGILRLMKSSNISLSIADAQAPDCPLIAINDAFTKMTGYTNEAVLGKNCRFLQPSGGAGPVRERMHAFIHDDSDTNSRFVVPNVRSDGEEFINLVYMSKLTRNDEVAFIMGSQFDITKSTTDNLEVYEQALKEDIRQLRFAAQENGLVLIGTYDQLASSHTLIAQLRLDEQP